MGANAPREDVEYLHYSIKKIKKNFIILSETFDRAPHTHTPTVILVMNRN